MSDRPTDSWGARAGPLVVLLVALLGSWLGLLTRPPGMLASFWPANALLAGLLVRKPKLLSWWTLPSAAAGFLLADLVTGDQPALNAWLTMSNLISAGVVVAVLRALPLVDRRMRRPRSVLWLMLAALGAGLASATVIVEPVSGLLGAPPTETWSSFFGAEFANHIAILPVLLTVRRFGWPRRQQFGRAEPTGGLRWSRSAGVWLFCTALLVLAHLLAIWVGGPGSTAFTLPALLIAALALGIFPTTVLALVSTGWTLIAVGRGWIEVTSVPLVAGGGLSLQIGLSLMATGPIAVATAMKVRDDAFLRLRQTATVDELTGALNRGTFLSRARTVVEECRTGRQPVVVLMLDLDHFKQINDSYGHAAGDRVLVSFGELTRTCIRQSDLFGRIGGEEFAVVLPHIDRDLAQVVAERIRLALEGERFPDLPPGTVTVSIGLADSNDPGHGFSHLLSTADRALYRAKSTGRNRVSS